MTFTYEFEKADWIAFYLHHVKAAPAYRKWRFWSRLLLIPVALLLALLGLLAPERNFDYAVFFSVVAVVWFFAWPRVANSTNAGRIRKVVEDPENAKVFGRQIMTLTPESIHVTRPGAESTIAWTRVVKVVESQDHIFVYISAIEAIVIPRLSLEGASFDEVRDQIRRYHSGSNSGPPSASGTGVPPNGLAYQDQAGE